MKGNFPNFIHIGPGRSGTTFIYKVFEEHPEITLAKDTKETGYFTSNYSKGESWYLKFFEDDNKAIGEFGNTYIYSREALIRIKKDFPEVKVIVVLRNPYDRLVSLLNYRKRAGILRSDANLEDLLSDEETLAQNFYYDQVKFLFKTFKRSQIFVGLYDDLSSNPSNFLKKLFVFLEVDPDFKAEIISKMVNKSVTVKRPVLVKFGRLVADTLRALEFYKTLSKLKNSQLVRRLLFNSEVKENKLCFDKNSVEILNGQIEALQGLVQRDLSHWKL